MARQQMAFDTNRIISLRGVTVSVNQTVAHRLSGATHLVVVAFLHPPPLHPRNSNNSSTTAAVCGIPSDGVSGPREAPHLLRMQLHRHRHRIWRRKVATPVRKQQQQMIIQCWHLAAVTN